MDLSRFDLNLLRALDALLDERNVTRAAARSFVTQQAMSGALQRLRTHFDDELLTRVGRGLEPTPLARSLALPVREALLAVQTALDTRPVFDPEAATGTVRIAMSDYGLMVMLPKFLQRLGRVAPHLNCVVEPVTRSTFDRLEMGDLDFCLTAYGPTLYGAGRAGPRIRSRAMFHDDFVCVIDAAHPGVGATITLAEYETLRHNSAAFGAGVSTLVERAWAIADLQIEIAVLGPSFAALLFMLPGTQLVATAQRRLATAIAPSLGLKILECPLEIAPLQEDLVWHERVEHDPRNIFLRQVIEQACVELQV